MFVSKTLKFTEQIIKYQNFGAMATSREMVALPLSDTCMHEATLCAHCDQNPPEHLIAMSWQ